MAPDHEARRYIVTVALAAEADEVNSLSLPPSDFV